MVGPANGIAKRFGLKSRAVTTAIVKIHVLDKILGCDFAAHGSNELLAQQALEMVYTVNYRSRKVSVPERHSMSSR